MGNIANMMGSGIPAEQAKSIVGTIETAITATGTTQSDAYALKADATIFSTVGSGAGAVVSSTLPVDSEIRVYNGGANALKIYPPSGCTVNDESANAAVNLPAGEGCLISRLSNTIFGAAGVSDLTATEMEYLDGVTAGTQAANKAVIADANVNIGTTKVTALHIGTSGSETQVTATGAQLNFVAGVTAGAVTASKALVVGASKELASLGKTTFGTATAGLVHGAGASGAHHALGATAGNALEYYLTGTHTSGDMRGMYLRLSFGAAGGSGEALRAFATIDNFTVATGGTVNGAHISLGTSGASAAVSGAANALRCTFGIAAASTALGGTCSVIQVDTDFDTAVTVPPNFAFLRLTNTNTKKSNNFLRIPNVVAEAGGLFCAHVTQVMSHSIKIVSEDGTPYYIMCTEANTNRTEA